jgi:hypothetical protein
MNAPVKSLRPEDAELSKKTEELAALQSRLADLEFQLFNLRLDLTEFETIYCSRVGPLYSELDDVEALIAEKIARANPHDPNAAANADNARRQAEESRKAAADVLAIQIHPIRSGRLRDLYRTAAKRLHPDLSRDDADRKIRERLMKEANLAYARGDESLLQAILAEYESSPDTVLGNDVAAELVRVIRRISLVSKRIDQIGREIDSVKESELFKLRTLVEEGKNSGKDLLGEMAERLKRQIKERRDYLRGL